MPVKRERDTHKEDFRAHGIDYLISMNEVQTMAGSRTIEEQLHKAVHDGAVLPVRVGKHVKYWVSEIQAWLESEGSLVATPEVKRWMRKGEWLDLLFPMISSFIEGLVTQYQHEFRKAIDRDGDASEERDRLVPGVSIPRYLADSWEAEVGAVHIVCRLLTERGYSGLPGWLRTHLTRQVQTEENLLTGGTAADLLEHEEGEGSPGSPGS